MQAAWQRLRKRIEARLNRLLRRPPQHIALAGAATGVAAVFNARARVQYGPVDTSDLTAAVEELDGRIRQQVDRLADLHERELDDVKALRDALKALSDQLENEATELRTRDQRVAVGGIRPAAFGLFLTAVGLLLIGVGLIVAG